MQISVHKPSESTLKSINLTVKNNGFYPDVDLNVFRSQKSQSGTVTDERLLEVAQSAVIEVNTRTIDAQRAYQSDGYSSLDDVPAEKINGESVKVNLYMQSVFSLIAAKLAEAFIGFDATGKGEKDIEKQMQIAETHRRDLSYALNDFQNKPRVTIDLI